MPTTAPSAYVQQAEETEQQLIERAVSAVSSVSWVVGECAAKWTERYARGRTDEDFAAQIGMSAEQVQQRRRTYEVFGDVRISYENLSWSHFNVATGWDDAPDCLQWADEMRATVAEMKAWRRAQRGEDLTADADPEPFISDTVPVAEDAPQTRVTPTQAVVDPVDDDEDPDPEPEEPYTPYRQASREGDDQDRSIASTLTHEPSVDAASVRTISQRLDAFETVVLAIEGDVQRTQIAARLRSIADRLEAE